MEFSQTKINPHITRHLHTCTEKDSPHSHSNARQTTYRKSQEEE